MQRRDPQNHIHTSCRQLSELFLDGSNWDLTSLYAADVTVYGYDVAVYEHDVTVFGYGVTEYGYDVAVYAYDVTICGYDVTPAGGDAEAVRSSELRTACGIGWTSREGGVVVAVGR